MAAPGTLLAHESLVLHQKVDVRYDDGFWYPGRVIGAWPYSNAKPRPVKVEVEFPPYPKTHNRKYLQSDAAIREPLSKSALAVERAAKIEAEHYQGRTMGKVADGVYTVDKIISRRRKNKKYLYQVRWEGWTEDFDTYEPRSAALRTGLPCESSDHGRVALILTHDVALVNQVAL